MKITPLDIQQQQFRKKGSRYECGEVDAFLDMVRLEMEEISRICASQADEIKRLQSELLELRSQEKLLKEAILTTQKTSEDIKKHAHKEAEIIVAEARIKGEQIIDQAQLQAERLHTDIVELKRQRIHVEAQFRAIMDGHYKLLEATAEDAKRMDIEHDKVAMMGKK